ncbi:hypothetical protein G6F37_006375 [Rhizopus arrhizus]|nr:hypothetical protein G6F38_006458 [Rhizopus arrhizus]KAG1157803.1 hypothetical protein G6F37_006375 [Rhizopus arrhizus]
MPLRLSDYSYSMPPAASGQQRQQFFDHVLDLLHNQVLDINLDRLFITRDFNYSYSRPHLPSQISLQWISFLNNYFCNALMNDDLHKLPTFRRNDTTYSMIDYIFVNQAFRIQVTESSLHNLDASWAGHSLFSVTCCLDLSPSDLGLWRENSLLTRKSAYQQYLRQLLDDIVLKIHSGWNTQKKWDFVKIQVKKSDRSRFVRSKPPLDAHLQHLTVLDQQIVSSQQELPKILALKANIRWQEADESSVKYLKNLYRQRTVEQHIITLPPNISTKPAEVEQYLADIQSLPQLTDDDTGHLLEPITIDEIIHKTARVENKISSSWKMVSAMLSYINYTGILLCKTRCWRYTVNHSAHTHSLLLGKN